MITSFIKRNSLLVRIANNIEVECTSVDQGDVTRLFNNVSAALKESTGAHMYKYDETCVTDDPGSKKVIVPRKSKRVEQVRNFSKNSSIIMICANANRDLLPSMVVSKLHRRRTKYGTIYANSSSG